MKVSMWISFVVLIGTLFPMSGCSSNAELPSSPADSSPLPKESQVTVDETLWWLPEDTESVAVAQNFPSPTQKQDAKVEVPARIAEVALSGLGRGKFVEQLFQAPVLRIVTGSRKFRTPKSIGLATYEGCSVIHLPSDLSKDHALQKWLAKNANRTATVAGHKAFIFDEKLKLDQWRFFVVQPRPDLLLCATNKSFLESVLRRRQRSSAERQKTIRALPETLEEWKHLDTDAAHWGLRHYRRDQALRDPTSPLSGVTRMANVPDKSAIGLTYSLDEKQNTATVRYLTAPRNAAQMTKAYRNFWASLVSGMGGISDQSKKWRPIINERPGGLVEMQFTFADSIRRETSWMFMFGLLASMGHAILV